MSRLNLAIVGNGKQGRAHAHTVQRYPGARVATVVGEIQFKTDVESFIQEFGDNQTKAYYSIDEALADKSLDLDGIVIASPDPTHLPFVLKSIQSGVKYIFCEKPLGIGLQQANQINDELKKHPECHIMCGFQRRFDVDFSTLKSQVQAGAIGNVEIVRVTARDPVGPGEYQTSTPSAQTVVYNSLIHDIDMAHWIIQEEPVSVFAKRRTFAGATSGPRDLVIAILKYPSGKICTLEWTKGITYGYIQSLEVMGDAGMIKVDDTPKSNVRLFNPQNVGIKTAPTQPFFPERYREAYTVEMVHFLDQVRQESSKFNKKLQSPHQPRVEPRVFMKDVLLAAKVADMIVEAISKTDQAIHAGNSFSQTSKIPSYPQLNVKPWKPISDAKLNVVLVGAGRIGSIRAQAVARNPRAKLCYVVDVVDVAAKKLADKYGAKPLTDIEAALVDKSVNAVVISAGTAQHYDLIKRAAAAGKPIFCEKPVALTIDEIYASYKATAEAGVPLMVGWNRRHDPHFRRLNELSKDSSFGAPVYIATVCGDHPCPPTHLLISLGSIYHDLMVHDVDVTAWFTKSAVPDSVYAVGNTFIEELKKAPSQVLDTAILVLNWEKEGVTAMITGRRGSKHGYDQRVEVVGRSGELLAAENPLKSSVVRRGKEANVHDLMSYTFDDRFAESYANEIDNFVNLVLGNSSGGDAPQESRFEESLVVSLMTDAALLSSQTGKVVLLQK